MQIQKIKEKILEENFFRPKWYSIFINPYFINRNSILKKIKEFARNIDKDQNILDVGCGLKPYRNFFKNKNYLGIDIDYGGHSNEAKIVDKFYDGESIPYTKKHFDNIICTQVLEHTEKPELVVKEISRVIKNDGKVFISMPFIYPEHEIPFDFQRYTQYKHIKLLEENNFGEIQVFKSTGFFGTFGQLFIVYFFESMKFRASILKIIISITILAPIQILSLFLDFIFKKSGPTMDYIIVAKKNE